MLIPKKRPIPVGDYLQKDILDELDLTQGDLAKALNLSRKTISELVNNKRRITADTALRLGKFTNTSPQMWLGLQEDLDLWDALHSKRSGEIQKIKSFKAA